PPLPLASRCRGAAPAAPSLKRGTPLVRGMITRTRDHEDVRPVGEREWFLAARRERAHLLEQRLALLRRHRRDERRRRDALDETVDRHRLIEPERPLLDRAEEPRTLERSAP